MIISVSHSMSTRSWMTWIWSGVRWRNRPCPLRYSWTERRFSADLHGHAVLAVLHLVQGEDPRLEGEPSQLDAGLGGGAPPRRAGHEQQWM